MFTTHNPKSKKNWDVTFIIGDNKGSNAWIEAHAIFDGLACDGYLSHADLIRGLRFINGGNKASNAWTNFDQYLSHTDFPKYIGSLHSPPLSLLETLGFFQ
jgi:hypothetical protein